jgi:hypothetical protein
VSKSDDPERLLAEALRAQAVSTPVTMPPLPAVLTEGAGEPEPAVDEQPAADEAAQEQPAAEEKPEVGTFATAKAVTADDALTEPPKSDTPFTEEMVLRELSSGPMTGELATLRINNSQQHYETERFSPLENLYGGVGDGPGFGLISGSEVGSTVGPPVGEFDHLRSSARATTAVPTTKMKAERGQVPGWLILLFALVLGLAGGAVAGLLSMV